MCSIDMVKELISLTNAHNLTEIEIHDEMTRIRIKKNGTAQQTINHSFEVIEGVEKQGGGTCFSPLYVRGKVFDETSASRLQQELLMYPSEEKLLTECREITSPMVGTFYRALGPGSKPYIDVGVEVNFETVVGVIETMKIINEIKAGITGKVVEVLVEEGEAVEFGQPLFRVQNI